MVWYYVVCGLMIYPSIMVCLGKRKGIDAEKAALGVACIILFFFLAARAPSVGVDTKFYCAAFEHLSEMNLRDAFTADIYMDSARTWTFDLEPGYRLLNVLLGIFTSAPQVITAANALVIVVLLYVFLEKASPMPLLSIWLYITLGVFQTEMNVTRNAIAILICYNVLDKIKEKKPVTYVIGVLIASTFHSTAILMLLLYPLIRYGRLNTKRMTMLFSASLVIGILYPYWGGLLSRILPERFARYLDSGNIRSESALVGVFYAVLIIVVLLCAKQEERRNLWEEERLGMWMVTLNMCLFALGIGFTVGARTAAYFGPYMIVFVPVLLKRIQNDDQRWKTTVLVVLLCGAQYFLRMLVNNIGGSIPYTFFWS